MTAEATIAALAIAIAIAMAIAFCTSNLHSGKHGVFDQTPASTPPVNTESSTACERHHWRIAAREETAGRPHIVYRCADCGALEVREVW